MNDSENWRVIWKVLKWLLIIVGVLLLLLSVLLFVTNQTLVLLEPPYHLAVGWVPYLWRVMPQVQFNSELLLCSMGALALGMIGMQNLMTRLTASRRWPWRFTWMWCAVLIVMFCTSIAAIGIVHQTGWLFRLPTWIEWSGMGNQIKAVSNARQVLLSAHQYAKDHDGRLPDTCADMMPEIVTDSRIFWASVDRDMPPEPLIYAGAGMRDTDDGSLPVVWSAHASSNGRRAIVRLDGHAEIVHEEKFQEMLAALRENIIWRKAVDKIK
ncbi:MAG: hypothetical protein NTY98_09545 [Verrucomicrobia bacterium]|nr:hypothetical protein [Verrucomicrobiota bacterium]